MSYEVTATRKRPRDFDHLVGQDFVVSTLKNSLKTARIAHAYLFAGPRGVGKTSAARVLAKALNNPSGLDKDFDLAWEGAEEIARGRSIDVIEIDGASNTSVNDVRAIKDEVLFPPQASRYKIYIIDEVHMLSNSAFNALLKTIEEPPPYIVFIFATTELHKVPATIRSRCQQFVFRLIPLDLIKDRLKDASKDLGIEADEEALNWIARESTGSLRDAYTLFDQVVAFSENHISLEKIREKLGLIGVDQLSRLFEYIVHGKTQELLEYLHEIVATGVSAEQLLIDLSEYVRACLFLKVGVTRETLLGYSVNRFDSGLLESLSRSQLEKALAILLQTHRDLRFTLEPMYDLELMLCRLARIREYKEPQEILKDFGRVPEILPQNQAVAEKKNLIDFSSLKNASEAPKIPEAAKSLAAVFKENPKTQDLEPSSKGTQELSREHKNDIIHACGENISLAGFLEQTALWEINNTTLVLSCVNTLALQSFRSKYDVLLEAVRKVLPFIHEIQFSLQEKKEVNQEQSEINPNVELIKEVFKGEIIKENE